MERHETQDLHPSNLSVRRRMEGSKFLRGLLKAIGVLAVSMVIADGILTPAQSVLGYVNILLFLLTWKWWPSSNVAFILYYAVLWFPQPQCFS